MQSNILIREYINSSSMLHVLFSDLFVLFLILQSASDATLFLH